MIYLFEHPQTLEIIEVNQSINEKHEYIDSEGVKYHRIFTIPQTIIDGHINPYNSKQFIEKTAKTKDNVGALWDRSRELSEKRKNKDGFDPIQKAYFQDYKKQRRGKVDHPTVRKEQLRQELNKNFEVEL